MRKLLYSLFFLTIITINIPDLPYGYTACQTPGNQEQLLELETEYLYPINYRRDIDTVSFNILYGQKSPDDNQFSYYHGITFTHAWGNIIRFHKETDSTVFGVGPVLLIRYEPWQWEHLKLGWDMSGALIFYNEEFPTRGDYYNFMWRFGPKLTFQTKNNYSVCFSYKLMHVSNGQFTDTGNPTYNGRGFSMSVIKSF